MREHPQRCKLCRHPLTPDPVRWCHDCKRPIRRHDKYQHRRLASGGSVLVHRCCEYPSMGLTPEAYRQQHGERLFERMKAHFVRRKRIRAATTRACEQP